MGVGLEGVERLGQERVAAPGRMPGLEDRIVELEGHVGAHVEGHRPLRDHREEHGADRDPPGLPPAAGPRGLGRTGLPGCTRPGLNEPMSEGERRSHDQQRQEDLGYEPRDLLRSADAVGVEQPGQPQEERGSGERKHAGAECRREPPRGGPRRASDEDHDGHHQGHGHGHLPDQARHPLHPRLEEEREVE